jgi:hypothetical protein
MNPGIEQILSLLQTRSGAHADSYAIRTIVLSRGLKWQGREFNRHLHLGPRYTCTTPLFSILVLIHITAGKATLRHFVKWPTVGSTRMAA